MVRPIASLLSALQCLSCPVMTILSSIIHWVVAMEDDCRTTHDVVFDEFVQVAVRPIEDGEVGVVG